MDRTHQPFELERPVQVYFNFHRRCWSVRQRGLVVGHAKSLVLRDVTWRVQPSGRERVRREGKKNVHAYASGSGHRPCRASTGQSMPVRYNPNETGNLHGRCNNQPLFTSRFATFDVEEEKKKKKKKKKTGTRKPDTPELKPRTWTCGINLKESMT